jgi:hypothetical protein
MDNEGAWYDLSTEDLCDLLIPPGVRGVPADDERDTILEMLHEHVGGPWRGSQSWGVELAEGVHRVRFVKHELERKCKLGLEEEP